MDECKPLLSGEGHARDFSHNSNRIREQPCEFHTPRTRPGRAVQVDPIKPTLEAPGIKLKTLNRGKPLSKFALKCNLRLYTLGLYAALTVTANYVLVLTMLPAALLLHAKVGRCRLTLSSPL